MRPELVAIQNRWQIKVCHALKRDNWLPNSAGEGRGMATQFQYHGKESS